MSQPTRKGVTMAEILLIVTLLIILITVVMISVTGQIGRAEDAQTKAALAQLKRVFEEYYNDHNCYPPYEWFDGPEDCNSSNMKPYLESIPCNGKTKRPYRVFTDSTGCRWYGLYARINENTGEAHCLDGIIYNYFVGSSNATPQDACYTYYCQSVGVCSKFDINAWDCTPAYATDMCEGSTGCAMTGSCSRRQ